ncbi:hypothetical protein F4679DRAFT_109710 [Xylaria curta]|nr:hypothetical protein F4679DRAFT_109710 [Xylaria curta]
MVLPKLSFPERKPTYQFHTDPSFNVDLNNDPNDHPWDLDIPSMPRSGVHCALHQLQLEAPSTSSMLYQPVSHPGYNGLDNPPWLDSVVTYSGCSNTSKHDAGFSGLGKWRVPFQSDARNMVLDPCHYNAYLNDGYSQAMGASSTPSASPLPLSPSSVVTAEVSPGKSLQCNDCSRCFKHKKDLNRHMKTVHATGNELFFRCRCGKTNLRKDNYICHVRPCSKVHLHSEYSCRCATACADKDNHLVHVSNCQYGSSRPGRPHAA